MPLWEATSYNLAILILLISAYLVLIINLFNTIYAFSKMLIGVFASLLLISIINLFFTNERLSPLPLVGVLGPIWISSLLPILLCGFTLRYLNLKSSRHYITWSFIALIAIIQLLSSTWSYRLSLHNTGMHLTYYWHHLLLWCVSYLLIGRLWFQTLVQSTDLIHQKRLKSIMMAIALTVVLPLDYRSYFNLGCSYPCFSLITLFGGLLLYFSVTSFPIFKPSIFLKYVTRHLLILTILALPLAWLSVYLLQLTINFSIEYRSIIILLLFAFSLPYIQFTYPFLYKYIFKKQLELIEITKIFLNKIIELKYPDKLASHILALLGEHTRLTHIKLIIKQVDTNHFYEFQGDDKIDIAKQYYLIFNWFKQNPNCLFHADIAYLPKDAPAQLLWFDFFKHLNALAVMPLIVSHEFVGLISMSNENKIFSQSDYMFINKSKTVFSISLYNAYFYDQIRHLSRGLWEVNECLHEKIEDKNQALETALARMVSLKEEQKSFFTMSSHNLKTPLTSIKASSAMLWAHLPSDEFKHGLNRILSDNVSRLEDLLNNIILISKLQDNHIPDFNKLDIHLIIHSAQYEVNEHFTDKHLNWILDLDSDTVRIEGNATYIRLVCYHLFFNAAKFSAFGGNIKVTLKKATPQSKEKYNHLLHPHLTHDDLIEIVVADEGEGIPENEKESIFSSFHQVKESMKRYQGNGLGLFMVKRILKYHHGAITLDSKLHHGAVFSFVLPLDQIDCLWKEACD